MYRNMAVDFRKAATHGNMLSLCTEMWFLICRKHGTMVAHFWKVYKAPVRAENSVLAVRHSLAAEAQGNKN